MRQHSLLVRGVRQKTTRNPQGALEQRHINARYVCLVSHGCPLKAQGSRGQRTCHALHQRSKPALGTLGLFAQRSRNRLWLCYFHRLILRALKSNIFTRYTVLMCTVCVQCVSKALLIRPLHWKHVVHPLPTWYVFHDPDSNYLFLFFHAWNVRSVCVTGTNLGQRTPNEFRACTLLLSNARLTLVWRSTNVYIHTWKNAHIFYHAENVRRGWRTQ